MKKLLLIILLAVFSTGAMAEWTMVGTSGNGAETLYVDKSTITKKGNIAKMWVMLGYEIAQSDEAGSYLSDVSLVECDCVNQMNNILQITLYSENMMKGNVVKSEDYNKKNWSYSPPRTINERLWKIACGKK